MRLLGAWVIPLGEMFNDGFMSGRRIRNGSEAVKATYSYEILGGLITYEAFLATPRAEIPP